MDKMPPYRSNEDAMTARKKSRIRQILKKALQRFGVKKAGLFGSFLTDEFRNDSDIDLLVELGGRKSILDLVELKLTLEDLLNRRIDVVTYRSIHPMLRRSILAAEERLV